MHSVDWDYHDDLGLINHTSFLLNYLSNIIDGAQSYSDWINGDLYEHTDEHFGICAFPGMSSLILSHMYKTYNDAIILQKHSEHILLCNHIMSTLLPHSPFRPVIIG